MTREISLILNFIIIRNPLKVVWHFLLNVSFLLMDKLMKENNDQLIRLCTSTLMASAFGWVLRPGHQHVSTSIWINNRVSFILLVRRKETKIKENAI